MHFSCLAAQELKVLQQITSISRSHHCVSACVPLWANTGTNLHTQERRSKYQSLVSKQTGEGEMNAPGAACFPPLVAKGAKGNLLQHRCLGFQYLTLDERNISLWGIVQSS